MRVLLDTCVLSEIRRANSNPSVRNAVGRIPGSDLYISALTVGELAKGIALLDRGRRKRELEDWLIGLQEQFARHILPVDSEIAHLWGEIAARERKNGRQLPAVDGLIAATALRHGLTLMTRNTSDFQASGVPLVNPWPPTGVHEGD
jgi:toxin FitB